LIGIFQISFFIENFGKANNKIQRLIDFGAVSKIGDGPNTRYKIK
jgi:hypothetical protein